MSSTPNSSISNDGKSPTYALDQAHTSLQPPYGLRLGTILTLPPPQKAPLVTGTAASQIYPHPLNYPSQNLGAQLLPNIKAPPLKFGYPAVDSFNYPSLNQPQGPATPKLPQLPQVSLQNLPQTSFPLSTPKFPAVNDKALLQVFQPPQGIFQAFAPQNHLLPPQFPTQSLEVKSLVANGNTTLNTSSEPAYSKQIRYSSSDSENEKSPQQDGYNHTPKFIHSKHSKASKDAKLNRLKFTSALTPEYKPFVCASEGCNWSFARKSDLRRHAKSHIAPGFHCPYWKNDPTCHRNGGSFSRLDVLKRHLRLVHYIKDKDKAHSAADPGWCRACQKLFLTSKSFISHCEDCASQVAPAEWKANTSPKEQTSVADE
ncbi:hypothetical protein METBIDRAFT_134544 [Metschnikowia bicuspidata var. bicuspidata NRRL YB-4993]|uniref:C2H2-type domain-containing protein n=1 Tax=Metschnikowia bicuspidata var. bicuspidata NRRL YB-4993 TaxID=869754 RepID=A0A1A0HKT1_9ASCO|nr:hypothetical protein METBIDRAFT_134544 [Metschnikowia bicuspidata var. bicuspidata NRRL YB-4993]OBA24502.1 hypothetical protein METBIDRAFT_134544 [Metschnikowia bicuspidata var. bicuspidata NRRL YB-4993]